MNISRNSINTALKTTAAALATAMLLTLPVYVAEKAEDPQDTDTMINETAGTETAAVTDGGETEETTGVPETELPPENYGVNTDDTAPDTTFSDTTDGISTDIGTDTNTDTDTDISTDTDMGTDTAEAETTVDTSVDTSIDTSVDTTADTETAETEPLETEPADTEPPEPPLETANLRAVADISVTSERGGTQVVSVIKAGGAVYGEKDDEYFGDGEDFFYKIIVRGELIGYAPSADFISAETGVYAALPVEYGTFAIGDGETFNGSSRLVDVSEYNDKLSVPMLIDMKLSHEDAESDHPRPAFYSRNLCLLQYDAVTVLLQAQKIFNTYGYTIKICDAYRPTSVQRSWFNIVRVHKWVANPDYGDGGMHDRGIAVDITLVDLETGEELDMPTAMHTFSELSGRNSTEWTEEQTKNVDLLTYVMRYVGFTTISSEWWHFQLADKNKYLPTDHPIDEIPLVMYG